MKSQKIWFLLLKIPQYLQSTSVDLFLALYLAVARIGGTKI